MTAEPVHHALVEDKLDVLMAREAQRHHETPGTPMVDSRPAITECPDTRQEWEDHGAVGAQGARWVPLRGSSTSPLNFAR